jgi:hypothetical protein
VEESSSATLEEVFFWEHNQFDHPSFSFSKTLLEFKNTFTESLKEKSVVEKDKKIKTQVIEAYLEEVFFAMVRTKIGEKYECNCEFGNNQTERTSACQSDDHE